MEPFDSNSTQLRPLAEYSKRLPSTRQGKRLNRATLWRWALKGSGGVILRTERLGGGRFTCDAYVADFIAQLSGDDAPEQTNAPCRDRKKLLDRLGVKPSEIENTTKPNPSRRGRA